MKSVTTSKTIFSAMNGQSVPSVSNNILMRMGKPVTNGMGEHITDDRWIYVHDSNGDYAINVYRSEYCRKQSMMNISIIDSIGNKKISNRLRNFIEKVSPYLVFEKFGKTYQIFLKKVGRTYDIQCVKPYWYNTANFCNMKIGSFLAYEITINPEAKFYVNLDEKIEA